MSILSLPDEVFDKIFSYISYDEVSRCRLVCRRMNSISKKVLNRGFHKVERYHAKCLRHVKSQLPRRESERRKHPLARHCDILTAVETRLSLLGMTFMKFMEMNLCCFIPGKVLDEIYKVLRYVTSEQSPVRAHEVLQELRDLSSMAMEHFDEKISPAFRKRKETGPKIITGINIYSPSVSHSKSSLRHGVSEHKVHKWRSEAKNIVQKQLTATKDIQTLKQEVSDLTKANENLEKKVAELQTLVTAQLEKAREQDLRIECLNRLIGKEFQPSGSKDTENTIRTDIIGLGEDIPAKDICPPLQKKKRKTRNLFKTENARKRLKRD